MKILQTPARFYPYVGGVENYTYYLSKELIKLGHEVKVVCAREPKDGRRIDGMKIRRLGYVGKIANTNITPKLPLQLLKDDFDLIHTHLPTPWSADWSALTSKLRRKPLILSYHNDIVGEGYANYVAKLYNHTLLRIILERAKKIIVTQSKYVHYSPSLRKYRKKIVIIPYGIDTNRFKPIEGEENTTPTIFFLSVLDRYHKYKGLEYLFAAMRRIKDTMDVRLIVGGAGELLNFYQKMADSFGLKGNVDFVGFIPYEKTVDFFNKCDLFVLPSVSQKQEGFGIVLLEALSCAKPVVATEIVGVAEEVKERDAGIIIKPRDVEALANGITYLMQDPTMAKKMGKNGRKLVEEKYRWERIAIKTEEVYFSALK